MSRSYYKKNNSDPSSLCEVYQTLYGRKFLVRTIHSSLNVLWLMNFNMFLFCLVFAMFCVRLFICVLWSPAGKGLTSWLSFVVSTVSLSLSHWYPGSGVVLDCIDS